MKKILGVSTTNPILFSRFLPTGDKYQIVDEAKKLSNRVNFFLVPTVKLLTKRKEQISESNAVVFVFDTEPELNRLQGIRVIDYDCGKDGRHKIYELSKELVKNSIKNYDTSSTINIRHSTVIQDLLEGSTPSVMRGINTTLYKIKNVAHRKKITDVVIQFFNTEKIGTTELLRSLILVSKKLNLTTDFVKTLFSILDTKEVATTKKVLLKIRSSGGKENMRCLADKNNVSSFDLAYLLASTKKN